MSISTISNTNIANLVDLQSKQAYSNAESTNLTNEISDEYTESNDSQKFKDIVSKYPNITNMTKSEYGQMCQELQRNGLIHMKITCTSTTYGNGPLKEENTENINIGGWVQSTDENTKMDFLEGLKKQAEYNKENNKSKYQALFEDNVAFAEKVKYFQDQNK